MNSKRLFVCMTILMLAALSCVALCQTNENSKADLNENLKPLEPLLNVKWTGGLRVPEDGSIAEVVRQWIPVWDGKVVKFTNDSKDLNMETNGYYYWDPVAGKISMFALNNNGIFQNGTVDVEDGTIVLTGEITFPELRLEYKNTFEFTPEGHVIDRWFTYRNNQWMPGHVVDLTPEQ